jgi:hypothetical protein
MVIVLTVFSFPRHFLQIIVKFVKFMQWCLKYGVDDIQAQSFRPGPECGKTLTWNVKQKKRMALRDIYIYYIS